MLNLKHSMKAQREFSNILKLLQEIRQLSEQINSIAAQDITRKAICVMVELPKLEAEFAAREKALLEK
jgi:hypothetical protein